MSKKKNSAQKNNKKKVVLRSALLTTGLTAHLLSGAPAITNADPAAYDGDSFAYLSQYLGINSANAETIDNPNSVQMEDHGGETDPGGGSNPGHEMPTPPPVNNTPAPVTFVPSTPAPPANPEDSIQVLAVSAGNLTGQSASLVRSTGQNGTPNAELRLNAQGLTLASQQATRGETLAYRLPQLKGTDMQIVLDGTTLAPLATNTNKLSVSTADVGIVFPVDRLRVGQAAEILGVPADQVQIRIQIQKSAPVTDNNVWSKITGATPVGDAYTFRMLASSGTKTTEINGYDKRYGQQMIPVPEGSDTSQLGAVMLVGGKYVPIPVTFKDGQAVLHTTGGNPVMLVRYEAPTATGKWFDNALGESSAKGILEDRSPSAGLDREDFARMTVRALGLESYGSGRSALSTLISAGLLDGLPQGTQTNGEVTREEMMAILINASRQFDLALNPLSTPTSTDAKTAFSDSSNISNWADSYVEEAYAAGLFQGDRGKVEAKRQGTAGEAAALLINLLHSTGLGDK
ncbi:S-layer homology domain-containing protein [Saccharibacillus sp. JS10]|uniref:S-layer homology domain-containing protein n=1 Tax=Saccharibacillus sp. JS10 TaxID=2950552 RepID=UPI00210A090A|nr:S-layer homology domain-containing protein [Saccharibacillus sp. JS10]MCQ4087991.1 S-layer homology domain-containing protein [Saccharibacillus sp. JS10]